MKKEKLTKTHQRLIGVLSIVVLILFVVIVCWYIGRPMLKLAKDPEQFRDWIDSYGYLGKIIFIGMIILQILFAIIPGEPLEIGAGYAFGAIEGTVLCTIGGFIGSIIVFALVRKLGIKFVETFFSMDKINNLKLLNDRKKFNVVMFLIFFIPGTPKDLFVYFLGLTKISVPSFLFITTIARLPSIITSTVGGNALGSKQYILAIVVFSITLVISAVGYFIYNRVSAMRENTKKEP